MKNKFLQNLLAPVLPLLTLEDVISHRTRFFLQKLFGFLTILLFLASLFAWYEHIYVVRGVFCFSLFIWLWLFCIESYFYALYEYATEDARHISFEIARVLYYCDGRDLVLGFLLSDVGDEVMRRIEFTEADIKEFLRNKTVSTIDWNAFDNKVTPNALAKAIYDSDKDFSTLLLKRNVSFKEFEHAFLFVIKELERKISLERFWSKEQLSSIEGIGKNWSFGETFLLERYGRDITNIASSHLAGYEGMHKKTIKKLESILLKSVGGNALIVSNDEASRRDVITIFASYIRDGKTIGSLLKKRVFLIDTNLLIENSSEKLSFERHLEDLLIQAHNAQNVILVIPFFSSFLQSTRNIGSDALAVLRPYFLSPLLHIIALDDANLFEKELSSNASIMENFELLRTDISDEAGIIHMLEEEVFSIEQHHHMFFSYLSLTAIVSGAKRYFDVFDSAEKAKDLLEESIPFSALKGSRIVTREIISALIESKTGVPISRPTGEEQDKLLHLEDELHKRIIGQDEAVKALAQAVRRNRSGIQNPNRPIGSFLFLGSTGVGKTETTKALANIFFKDEQNITRFDMSEYSGSDGLSKLIGFFGNDSVGVLVQKIKEKPYGVVLLDEFEKANQEVHNLFLQILDEGSFSDSSGHKINARNILFIATSNAGSDMLFELTKQNENILSHKEEIVSSIIKSGIFKPELLNRFDGVILFHPLKEEHLRQIASLVVEGLAKRLKEKSILLKPSEDLINFLLQKGSDPKFGARPMMRAVQDEVEELIAKGIIEGKILAGSEVAFRVDQNQKLDIQIV